MFSYLCTAPTGFPNTLRIAHVVKFVLRSITLPFEIRAIAPSCFNDYAAGIFSRGIFHLYAALPLCCDVPVLKASSI